MSSVSGISSNMGQYQINWQNDFKQRQQDFSDLGSALQSGDLSAAQTAYSALVQSASSNNQTQTTQQSGTSGIGTDLTAIGQALQSGDISAAKTAYTKLQQDFQTAHAHHHHNHSGQAGATQGTSADAVVALLETGSSANESGDSVSTNGTVNITA